MNFKTYICFKEKYFTNFAIIRLVYGHESVCFFEVWLLVKYDSFVTTWTIACEAPLSMGFLRQEYCKMTVAKMGCHCLFQGDLLDQRSNLHLLHWQVDSLSLSHLGRPLVCSGCGKKQPQTWWLNENVLSRHSEGQSSKARCS